MRLPIRPARYAIRPLSTPAFIAAAISTGSFASAIAVFIRTPSQPSSIAAAASDAPTTAAATDAAEGKAMQLSQELWDESGTTLDVEKLSLELCDEGNFGLSDAAKAEATK